MSIKLTNTSGYYLATGSSSIWQAQVQASWSVFIMITSGSSLAALAGAKVMGGQFALKWNVYFGSVSGSGIQLSPRMWGASHSVSPPTLPVILPGIVYHLAGTWVLGNQVIYLNGLPLVTATWAEATHGATPSTSTGRSGLPTARRTSSTDRSGVKSSGV